MTRDSFWKNNPLLMMTRAHELGRLVEHLDAEQRDGVWREGTSIAVPVLLSLARRDRFEGMAPQRRQRVGIQNSRSSGVVR